MLDARMGEVKRELEVALRKCEGNEEEMRAKMDTAERKVQNYKDKLIEKQKYINSMENKQREESKEQSLLQENLQLLQRLQKAEGEL